VRFRQARHDAFDNFADFLPRFVAAASRVDEPAVTAEAATEGAVPAQPPAEHLMIVRDDEAKRKAVERLAKLYRDERILQLIPVEL
jgi:hypothetical protein